MSYSDHIETRYYADYYDGETPRQYIVDVEIVMDEGQPMLQIGLPHDDEAILWPVGMVRLQKDIPLEDGAIFQLEDGSPPRLHIRDKDAIRMMRQACPALRLDIIPRKVIIKASVVSVLSMLLIAALFVFFMPGFSSLLASRMSTESKITMGRANLEQTRVIFSANEMPLPICAEPLGEAALRKIVGRIATGVSLPYDLRVAVFDDRQNPQLNALAMPGGYIVLFDSVIKQAERPEEIAAVFAHELGHIVHDHAVASALQSASATLVFALLTGDVSGGGLVSIVGGKLVTSTYSRNSEIEADDFARNQLRRVGVPVSALTEFFRRMRDEYGDAEGIVAHLGTHPRFAERINASVTDVTPQSNLRPVLSRAEWAALRNICSAHYRIDTPPSLIDRLINFGAN